MISFEKRLRRHLRFRSWLGAFDDDIREVSAHYDDLVAEAKAKGMPDDEAAKFAEQLLGDPKTVAGEIVGKTPRAKGFRLQWLALALWLLFAFLPHYKWLDWAVIMRTGKWWPNLIWDASQWGQFLGGLLLAMGIFRARKVSWFAACCSVSIVLAGWTTVILRESGSFRNYEVGVVEANKFRDQFHAIYRSELEVIQSNIISPSPKICRQLANDFAFSIGPGRIKSGSYGQFAYPVGYEQTQMNKLAVVFGLTDSYPDASAHWRGATSLRNALARPEDWDPTDVDLPPTMHWPAPTATGEIYIYSRDCLRNLLGAMLLSLGLLWTASAVLRLLRERSRLVR